MVVVDDRYKDVFGKVRHAQGDFELHTGQLSRKMLILYVCGVLYI